MKTVLITGGTGMIGTALSKRLLEKGYAVIVLTRSRKGKQDGRGLSYAEWDVEKGTIDRSAIEKADAIIHLAGANVAEGRWTDDRKREILNSRVQSGNLLVRALSEIPNRVEVVVSSSAIGWYGSDPQVPNPKPFTETDPHHSDFLGTTCAAWERSLEAVAQLNKRLVYLRTGIVLGRKGGAYAEFLKPVRFGLAPVMGNGKQVVSWIHIDDLVALYIKALEDRKFSGVFNAVAPAPVSNKELILSIAKSRRSVFLPMPVPEFALKIMLGEMSIEILKSATMSSAKLDAFGFSFRYPTIDAATAALAKD